MVAIRYANSGPTNVRSYVTGPATPIVIDLASRRGEFGGIACEPTDLIMDGGSVFTKDVRDILRAAGVALVRPLSVPPANENTTTPIQCSQRQCSQRLGGLRY
jgi:hypothetical protein